MFSESVELYDTIYGAMKDYRAEARAIAERIERVKPGARTVLDIACGTGEHAKHLAADSGLAVDGIDLEPGFVAVAAAKNPAGRFVRADMRDFDLGRTYDAVICMFSSIGYAGDAAGVTAALRCFRAHAAPGGAIVVEPWFAPDQFRDAHVSMLTVDNESLKLCRMSRSHVIGRRSLVHFEYLIGRPGSDLVRASEDHELALLTVDEMRACFHDAGLECEHDPKGPMGRGLFVARAA